MIKDGPNWIIEAQAMRYLNLSSQRISQLCKVQFLVEMHLGTKMIWFEDVKKYARLIKQRKERREAKLHNKMKRINELQA